MSAHIDDRGWLTFLYRGEEFAFLVRNPDCLDSIQGEISSRGTFYELDELLLLREHLKPGARIIDAGANIGNHSVFFDRVCRASEVIVFEPNPDVIDELRANLERNACKHVNTSFLGTALGEASGRAFLFLSE